MRTLVGFGLSLLLATGLFAQHHGGFRNPHPFAQGTFGKGVLPGGATRQGLRRQQSVSVTGPTRTVIVYGYPVKDHTIYSAVAYWVDGDTLHYFTSGNTHNQASLSLIDRDLTERLNKESGLDVSLPPPTPPR